MDFEKLKGLLATDPAKGLALLNAAQKTDLLAYKKEYKGTRTIRPTQVGNRLDKTVGTGATQKTVAVAKIPINYQRKIVRSAATFLFGNPIQIQSSNSDALEIVQNVWDSNRMDALMKKACELVKSETEAVFFFFEEKGLNAEGKEIPVLKIRLYGSANGTYAPYFDDYGDMKAFTWNFDSLDENGKTLQNSWVFTEEKTEKFKKGATGWALIETTVNLYGKIPVVYMSQEEPDWFIVKELIDQNEMTLSKFIDTNAYFASPMVKIFGTVESMPGKDDQGKAVKIPQVYEDGKLIKSGDVEYLTWEHAPEAIKLENEISKDHIHSLTDTPDLSFNNVKGIGVTSGIALKLMFMGAITKSKWAEGDFSVAIERIINLIQAGHTKIVDIKSESTFKEFDKEILFTSILPDNISEIVTTLSEATGGKSIMSQETAVKNNPFVENTEEELEKITKEGTQNFGDTFTP